MTCSMALTRFSNDPASKPTPPGTCPRCVCIYIYINVCVRVRVLVSTIVTHLCHFVPIACGRNICKFEDMSACASLFTSMN